MSYYSNHFNLLICDLLKYYFSPIYAVANMSLYQIKNQLLGISNSCHMATQYQLPCVCIKSLLYYYPVPEFCIVYM